MAGLLDVFQSPEGMQALSLLSAAGPSMDPQNFASRLAMAGNSYRGMQQGQLKDKFIQSQIDENASQAELRKQQLALSQRRQEMFAGLLGQMDGAVPAANAAVVGQTGNLAPTNANAALQSQAYGQLTQDNPLRNIPRQAVAFDMATNDGKNVGEWMFKQGVPDMQNINGVWVDKNRAKAGDSVPQMSPNGQGYQLISDGAAPGGYRVTTPVGALDTYKGFKQADADIAAGSDLVKVVGADGAERYVPKSQVLGRGTPGPSVRLDQAGGSTAGGRTQALTQPGDSDRFAILSQELTKATNPSDKASIQREIDRLPASAKTVANPSGLATPGYQATPTTAQAAAAVAEKMTAEGVAKDVVEQRKGIMNAGFVASSNISRYQQIAKLLQDVDGGALTAQGTHLASLANSLGVKIDKNLPNKEAAASLANAAALELRNPAGGAGMPGAMSDADRVFLSSMTPNMSQSAQGRKQVIDSYIAVQQRNQQVATFARNYEKKYGKLDNGFFEQLQGWSNSNPLFKAQ